MPADDYNRDLLAGKKQMEHSLKPCLVQIQIWQYPRKSNDIFSNGTFWRKGQLKT